MQNFALDLKRIKVWFRRTGRRSASCFTPRWCFRSNNNRLLYRLSLPSPNINNGFSCGHFAINDCDLEEEGSTQTETTGRKRGAFSRRRRDKLLPTPNSDDNKSCCSSDFVANSTCNNASLRVPTYSVFGLCC